MEKCFIWFVRVFLFGVFSIVDAERGQPCLTPNGNLEICKSIYDCSHFIRAIIKQNPSELNFIKQSQCGFDTSFLVCCGADVNFVTSRNSSSILRKRELLSVNSSILPDQVSISDRKVCGYQGHMSHLPLATGLGAIKTYLDDHPWMALLGYTTRLGRLKWACGGTLISHRHVLTAAHCVTGEAEVLVGKVTHVKLGAYDKTEEIACDSKGFCTEEAVILGIESFSFHDNYDASDKTSSNDIAIIKLNQTVEYTVFIRPICLPESNRELSIYDWLEIVGWGLTDHGETNVKIKVKLPIRRRELCVRAYRSVGLKLSDSQICAGGIYGKDSCKGDSGGPLLGHLEREKPYQWYQEGIISFGNRDCGVEGLPGIYTKVSSFLPWIHSHIRE
uniref:CLIP domain-containing serine protease n=1 Tax=Diabrotica virgifera virgifera TaxID=50390 RepID=A0A6P7F8L9_DIAVI